MERKLRFYIAFTLFLLCIPNNRYHHGLRDQGDRVDKSNMDLKGLIVTVVAGSILPILGHFRFFKIWHAVNVR